jgi:hypothetical protein
MISLEDCIALCGLTREELDAIAEHEHVPEAAATALACYLLHREHGSEEIRNMIVDDIRAAVRDGRLKHAAELFSALRHFLETHPQAEAGLSLPKGKSPLGGSV